MYLLIPTTISCLFFFVWGMPTFAIWVAIGFGIYLQVIFMAIVLFCYVDWDAIPALDSDEAEIEFVRANSITQKEDNRDQGSIVENLL
jgi:hypothetical protein